MIKALPAANKSERDKFKIPRSVQQSIPIKCIYEDGTWLVDGPWLRQLMANVNFGDYESRNWFERKLRDAGVYQQLEELGVEDGDVVCLYNLEFEYQR